MGKYAIVQVAVMQRGTVLSSPCEPGGDAGMPIPEHAHRGRDIQSFRERAEHLRNAVRRRFEPIEWGMAADTESHPSHLATVRVVAFAAPMCPITDQGMDLRIGDVIVRTAAVGTGEPVRITSFGRTAAAFTR